jgi:L-Ala-D/L-Glu epimerase
MKLTFHRFDLPTRHPFTIARGTTTVQRTVVVELEQDGVRGFGEATESNYYQASVEAIVAALEGARPRTEAHHLTDPAAFWEAMRPELGGSTFAQCALDTAAYDLWGKLHGKPVWWLWGLDLADCPPSDYTIGIDTTEVMRAKLREFPGWPVYKIKLGRPDDVEVVRALREETDAVFRVDANCAWGAGETLAKAAALEELGVEFIEQPLPPGQDEAMERLYRESPLPLVADESCQVEGDVERCGRGRFHGVNIKLVKCGGLTPARRMIDRARQLDLQVMVGCFTDSTVGISAAAQLLPLVDYADLDGAVLLAEDAATGVRLEQGRVVFPEADGCGVTLLTATPP